MSPNTVISLDTENNDKSPDPFIKRRKKKKKLDTKSTMKLQLYKGKEKKI